MIARSALICSRGDAETRREFSLRTLGTLHEPKNISRRGRKVRRGFELNFLRASASPREQFSAPFGAGFAL
jgi:hypothetical protein